VYGLDRTVNKCHSTSLMQTWKLPNPSNLYVLGNLSVATNI